MAYDAVVIGAGMGGLACASRVAREGLRVVVLEKCPHVGGTSYIFRRKGHAFPMGPLAFSFPQKVKILLAEAGVTKETEFRRNHFELLAPGLEVIYSRPLKALEEDLAGDFPWEKTGVETFFREIEGIIRLTEDIEEWHPDFLTGSRKIAARRDRGPDLLGRLERIRRLSETRSKNVLEGLVSDGRLRNLLGSLGTDEPEMSMLNLAFMWNVMSEAGIWSPSCGIHGLGDALAEAFKARGGEIRLATPAAGILTKGGRVAGVTTAAGEVLGSRWVVSTADYKTTFLDLLPPGDAPREHLDLVRKVPYTGSELCVYLGVDTGRVDLSRMKVDHLFYRREVRAGGPFDPGDFANREVEICLWAKDAPGLVPEGRASILLRASFPYDPFAAWRTGEKLRRDGYREFKTRLARGLVETADHLLPGLSSSIEVMDAATPLTYQDWGHRRLGSIAGWTWSADKAGELPGKLLVETPIPNLLTAGIYAATELFLGGVPTALHTGTLAAHLILEG
jgi:phytoene dehydrogenase-like protein